MSQAFVKQMRRPISGGEHVLADGRERRHGMFADPSLVVDRDNRQLPRHVDSVLPGHGQHLTSDKIIRGKKHAWLRQTGHPPFEGV